MVDSVLTILKELQDYYGTKLTNAQLNVYVRNLSDIEITMLRQGTDDIIQRGAPFFPKVAELRKAAQRFSPVGSEKVENQDYWRAMSTYNDVLAGRQQEGALHKWAAFFPEVKDGTSGE
jgi:hypothetical protein